jgi:hypothetical protein
MEKVRPHREAKLNLDYSQRQVSTLGLAGDESLPGISALVDDLHGVPNETKRVSNWYYDTEGKRGSLLVLALAGKGELVLGLAVGDLVDAEPLIGSTEKSREVAFNVLDVVELGSKRVVHIDDDDLPVSLFLVQQGHDAEDLDLLDLAAIANEFADFADIERVVVALGLCLGMNDIGIFPGLSSRVRS